MSDLELGLSYEAIESKLKENGISDENLIESIANVICENNRAIEGNLLKVIDEQLALQKKMNFF